MNKFNQTVMFILAKTLQTNASLVPC